MQSMNCVVVLLVVPVVVHAFDCPANTRHKDTTKLSGLKFCAGDKWSPAGLSDCRKNCCDPAPTCGGLKLGSKIKCTANKSIGSGAEWEKIISTEAAAPTKCCVDTWTCSKLSAGDCSGGIRANSTTTKCDGASKALCRPKCCEVDTRYCGGSSNFGCAVATQYDPNSIPAVEPKERANVLTDAWKSKNASTKTNCCLEKAACSSYTCPVGMKDATDKATRKCKRGADTCKFSSCCVMDAKTCAGASGKCPLGKYRGTSDAMKAKVFSGFAADCCVDNAMCSAVKCSAGYKKAPVSSCTSGASSTCATSGCCKPDVSTCGGVGTIKCALGYVSYGARYAGPKTAGGDAAKYATWAKQKTTEANKNKATSLGGCCVLQEKCKAFKAGKPKTGTTSGNNPMRPGLLCGFLALCGFTLSRML